MGLCARSSLRCGFFLGVFLSTVVIYLVIRVNFQREEKTDTRRVTGGPQCMEQFRDRIPSQQQLKFYNNTDQIFYNRMPKCGSEMTMTLLRNIAKKNHWTYPPENKRIWTITKQGHQYWVDNEKVLKEISHLTMDHKKPMLFSCHLYYTDFSRLWSKKSLPTYINIIRNPQDRLISLYYYFRFHPIQRRNDMSNNDRAMTYDDCVEQQKEECTAPNPEGFWTMVPYFCGHDPICRTPSRDALERAKANVVSNYAVIGLTEDMETFTRVLENVIPKYFRGMTDLYRQMASTVVNVACFLLSPTCHFEMSLNIIWMHAASKLNIHTIMGFKSSALIL
ncbi:hypothetical protein CAPTEDRAFT_189618 [Capitella teleta]|uniref:Sulfotransferase domain-containing protein n=1 Tax=Capitella teleta TaxID=283909 RepID=R7V1S9_CAPTE|nr:hypothetical protein CAPTEDRAFT_189618 [Capitella teleta]|eukprot:ELU09621.1 hypothetical protein CAPTEDRAFT_189618 [Capitella teleta]